MMGLASVFCFVLLFVGAPIFIVMIGVAAAGAAFDSTKEFWPEFSGFIASLTKPLRYFAGIRRALFCAPG